MLENLPRSEWVARVIFSFSKMDGRYEWEALRKVTCIRPLSMAGVEEPTRW